MKLLTILALLVSAQTSSAAPQLSEDQIKDLPDLAKKVRLVVNLPERRDENSLRVEVTFTKQVMVDCNTGGLIGSFTEKQSPLLRIPYVVLGEVGYLSSMMACPGSARAETLYGERKIIAYTSKYPLIVYAPRDVSVRYRVLAPVGGYEEIFDVLPARPESAWVCERFTETCRAKFCTGGYLLKNDNGDIFKQFRTFDFPDALNACLNAKQAL